MVAGVQARATGENRREHVPGSLRSSQRQHKLQRRWMADGVSFKRGQRRRRVLPCPLSRCKLKSEAHPPTSAAGLFSTLRSNRPPSRVPTTTTILTTLETSHHSRTPPNSPTQARLHCCRLPTAAAPSRPARPCHRPPHNPAPRDRLHQLVAFSPASLSHARPWPARSLNICKEKEETTSTHKISFAAGECAGRQLSVFCILRVLGFSCTHPPDSSREPDPTPQEDASRNLHSVYAEAPLSSNLTLQVHTTSERHTKLYCCCSRASTSVVIYPFDLICSAAVQYPPIVNAIPSSNALLIGFCRAPEILRLSRTGGERIDAKRPIFFTV